jgi:hypothetical protein
MSQATLASFSEDQFRGVTKKLAAFDCHNCRNQRGFHGPKVKCFGTLKDVPQKVCSSWTDGNDLGAMLAFAPPADFVPKKWRGEA